MIEFELKTDDGPFVIDLRELRTALGSSLDLDAFEEGKDYSTAEEAVTSTCALMLCIRLGEPGDDVRSELHELLDEHELPTVDDDSFPREIRQEAGLVISEAAELMGITEAEVRAAEEGGPLTARVASRYWLHFGCGVWRTSQFAPSEGATYRLESENRYDSYYGTDVWRQHKQVEQETARLVNGRTAMWMVIFMTRLSTIIESLDHRYGNDERLYQDFLERVRPHIAFIPERTPSGLGLLGRMGCLLVSTLMSGFRSPETIERAIAELAIDYTDDLGMMDELCWLH